MKRALHVHMPKKAGGKLNNWSVEWLERYFFVMLGLVLHVLDHFLLFETS